MLGADTEWYIMDAEESGSATTANRSKLECTRLESIPEMNDPDFPGGLEIPGSPIVAIRSKSLPGPVTFSAERSPAATPPGAGSPKPGDALREVKMAVFGYVNVGKSALVVRYLTKRFIGDYASYETLCTAETFVDYKKVTVSILDMSWRDDISEEAPAVLDWCDGALFIFSLVDNQSFIEIDRLCRILDSKLKKLPCVLVGTKSDLAHARKTAQSDIQSLASKLKCPYVETSARESHASCTQAFTSLIHETRNKNKSRRNANKNGHPSKLKNIRDRLRSIAGEFRQRTNTF